MKNKDKISENILEKLQIINVKLLSYLTKYIYIFIIILELLKYDCPISWAKWDCACRDLTGSTDKHVTPYSIIGKYYTSLHKTLSPFSYRNINLELNYI